MAEKYFSLESIKQDIEWLVSSGNQELPLREVLERFEYGAIRPADVRPVVRGRWEIVTGSHGKEYMVCSECRVSQTLTGTFSYCPNCGADMREEKP